jgi:hypothetical protein
VKKPVSFQSLPFKCDLQRYSAVRLVRVFRLFKVSRGSLTVGLCTLESS